MKNHFIKLVCIACILLTGCSKEELHDSIAFNIEVLELHSYTASVMVTHNATNDDCYYGIVVEGTVKDINKEITRFVESTDPVQLKEQAMYQRKRKVEIFGLLPDRTYTYIIFGMNGQSHYGKPSSVVIQTQSNHIEAKINPDWSIEYHGHTIYNGNDFSKLSVKVNGEAKERYYLALFPFDRIKDIDSIEIIIGMAFSEMKKGNSSEVWFENNEIRLNSTTFYKYLHEGDYVAYVIGIDESCTPTGNYVKTEVFHVDKYPYTEEFENLLGDWYLVDNTGKSYRVTFSDYITNRYLYMTGWGNFDDPLIEIFIEFNRKNGTFYMENQVICENYSMTFPDGVTLDGNLCIRGTYINEDGKHRTVNNDKIPFILSSFNTYTAAGFNVKDNDGNTFDGGMALYIKGKEKAAWYATMMFPLTMYKID